MVQGDWVYSLAQSVNHANFIGVGDAGYTPSSKLMALQAQYLIQPLEVVLYILPRILQKYQLI